MSHVPQELCAHWEAPAVPVGTPMAISVKRRKPSLAQEKWEWNLRETKGSQDGDTGHWNDLIYHFCQNKFRYP